MHVVVENTVCLNSGDAAILIALKRMVIEALGRDVEFYVFDSHPEAAGRLYGGDGSRLTFRPLLSERIFKYPRPREPLKNVVKALLNRLRVYAIARLAVGKPFLASLVIDPESRWSLDIYREAALVVTTGGTYLVETYNLQRRMLQFHIDCLLGRAPVFFTQSLGPFDQRRNRDALRPVLARSPLILLRDDRSLRHLAGLLGGRTKCHVIADSVFALADTRRLLQILSANVPPARRGLVGISVRHWHYVRDGEDGMRRYVEALRQVVTELVQQGNAVTFVSTCQGVPEYAHDDSKTAEAIVSGLDPRVAAHVTIDAGFHRPEQLMELAAAFDFVISTRMHMMILSLCAGTPVLPIAYEFKTRELAQRLGISEVLLDIDSISGDEAVAKVALFAENLDAFRRTSLEGVLKESASALSAVIYLKRVTSA